MSTLLVLNKVRVFLSDIFGSEIHFLCYERVVEKLCQKLVQTVCRLCYLQQELYSSKWTSAQQYQRDSTRTSWRKLWTDSRSIGHYRKNTRLRVNVNILRRWRLLIRWTADVQAASTLKSRNHPSQANTWHSHLSQETQLYAFKWHTFSIYQS